MKQPTIIFVLGLPASGKSTLAKRLAQELKLPLVSKDDLKVMLFDEYGWAGRKESEKAGRVACGIMDMIIDQQMQAGYGMVVDSTFNPDYSSTKFQKLQQLQGIKYAQVWCHADPDVIRSRFKARAAGNNRHVSSVEGKDGLQNLETILRRGFAPLRIKSEIIEVDTTDFALVDEAGIVARLRTSLGVEAP